MTADLSHALPRVRGPKLLLTAAIALILIVGMVTMAGATANAVVVAAPALGAAGNFAVLAGTAVTCSDGDITGDVGVSPGTAITLTFCPVTGTINAPAAQARTDYLTAYNAFKALPCDVALTTLDDQTLAPGVYCFDAGATSTDGVLTLNGPADGIWIFKIGTLGTGALAATGFSVMLGDAQACNVYWWVAEGATMTGSDFSGTILAGTSTTLTDGTFNGRDLAKAAVTITRTSVTGCGGAPLRPGNPVRK
ncbi:MAG TPA: ice-binding family protein [Candidatus Limnocylindria bacterium]|nr:ice-binding family protein [Candidatus Limnocylindria bacterium]